MAVHSSVIPYLIRDPYYIDSCDSRLRGNDRKGFTLIELLVVIAIIAILSAIGLVVFSTAQKSGRMSKRIGDLKAIQTALELYHNANNAYPSTGGSGSPRSECANNGSYLPADVIPGLTPSYLVAMPSDPSMDKANSKSCYWYASDGLDYKIADDVISEFTQADYQSQRNLIDPRRDGGSDPCVVDPGTINAWAIYTDGARCW